MNIFALDRDAAIAAQYHCDRHVVKMILETGQLLSTALHVLGKGNDDIYKKTHVNHPCSVWVRETHQNFSWAVRLFDSLCDEYTHRYGKIHATTRIRHHFDDVRPEWFPSDGLKEFPQAMPDDFKDVDSIVAYRQYYKFGKAHILSYKNRQVPHWLGID